MPSEVTFDADVALVRMNEPRGNALSFATIEALHRALDLVEQKNARACVLVGTGRVFCVGLDLRECIRFDEEMMRKYVDAFEALFERMFAFRIPLIAALNGHAIAGGGVIALACDVRVMSSQATLAVNEVELGLPFPSVAFEIVRYGLPASSHVDGIMLGKSFNAAECKARGIADVVADDTEAVAIARAREFVTRGAAAVSEVKRALRNEALSRARTNAASSRATFIQAFRSEDTQARMNAVVAKLEKR